MKKTLILHKKLTRMEAHQGKLVIGIAGSHKGAGVTHFGIMLTTYLSEWVGKKTVYLEYSPKKSTEYLRHYIYGDSEEYEDNKPFVINHSTFYSNVKEQDAAEILGDRYDCVVLDLGTDFLRYKNEFLRCDKRIVVSSLTIWKRYELEKFINNTEYLKSSSQWNYLIPFCNGKEVKHAAMELQRKIYGVPYEPDPFNISKETLQLFQKML